jgi:hypothetical protein
MHKRIGCVVLMLVLMTMWGNAAGFEENSFRLRSIGTELQWIVDDEYSDTQMNPASINQIQSNWIITNFSNLGNGDHRFLDYGNNSYIGSSGRFLLGGFRRISDWTVGCVGDYWCDRQWASSGPQMRTDFARNPRFYWYTDGVPEEGTWVTKYDNGTESPSDDFRVTEVTQGTRYNADQSGIRFKLIFGRDQFGLSYDFTRKVSGVPGGVAGRYRQYAFHSYDLMEQGTNSAKEAVRAVQEEVNQYESATDLHVVSFGVTRDLDRVSSIDVVARVMYESRADNSQSRRKKSIDYDPDDDGIPYEDPYTPQHYNQYKYQGFEVFDADLSALGYGLDGRYTRIVEDGVRLRLLGRLHYQPLRTDEYEERSTTQEMMIAFPDGTDFENASDVRRYGDKELNSFSSLAGAGAMLQPVDGLTMGFAVKWYYDFTEAVYDLISDDGISTHDYKRQVETRKHRLALPLGIEYVLGRKYAVRLGVNTDFLARKTKISFTGPEEGYDYVREKDVTSISHTSLNETSYSYGLGYEINHNFHLDATGITDLVDVGSLFLSLVITY